MIQSTEVLSPEFHHDTGFNRSWAAGYCWYSAALTPPMYTLRGSEEGDTLGEGSVVAVLFSALQPIVAKLNLGTICCLRVLENLELELRRRRLYFLWCFYYKL